MGLICFVHQFIILNPAIVQTQTEMNVDSLRKARVMYAFSSNSTKQKYFRFVFLKAWRKRPQHKIEWGGNGWVGEGICQSCRGDVTLASEILEPMLGQVL